MPPIVWAILAGAMVAIFWPESEAKNELAARTQDGSDCGSDAGGREPRGGTEANHRLAPSTPAEKPPEIPVEKPAESARAENPKPE